MTRKIISTLHNILNYAISQDWVATNSARGIRVIGPRDEGSKRVVAPSKAVVAKLLEAANDDLRIRILFAASTGLRAGEQGAVRWADINFEKRELRVVRRVDAYGDVGAPKSMAGVRTVPLSNALVRALKAWRLLTPGDLVFPKGGGFTEHVSFLCRRFEPLIKATGVPRFNWHGLRHFAVSCWIEAGLQPKTIQSFAGHSSLAVTMDVYGHLLPNEDHRRVMDAIAKGLFA